MEEKLTIIRGDSPEIDITFTDAEEIPVDLTGKVVFFTVKKYNDINSDDDDDALISKKIETHTDPTNGKTQLNLSSEDTDINAGDYLYDLQLVSGLSVISTERNIIKIIEDITKRIT